MCLAVPGRLESVEGDDPAFRIGCVDFCGTKKTVNLAYTPDAAPGDFLLVHVGFAVARMDAEEARRTFQDLQQIGAWAEEAAIVAPTAADEVLDAGAVLHAGDVLDAREDCADPVTIEAVAGPARAG